MPGSYTEDNASKKELRKRMFWAYSSFKQSLQIPSSLQGRKHPTAKEEGLLQALPKRKNHHSAAVPIPDCDIRLDRVDHFPSFTESQQRCRLCSKGNTHIKCCKCKVALCLVKGCNCFVDFHMNWGGIWDILRTFLFSVLLRNVVENGFLWYNQLFYLFILKMKDCQVWESPEKSYVCFWINIHYTLTPELMFATPIIAKPKPIF